MSDTIRWEAVDNEGIDTEWVYLNGVKYNIPNDVRSYNFTYQYEGYNTVIVKVKDYRGFIDADTSRFLIYNPDSNDITASIRLVSGYRVYDAYLDYIVPEIGNYILYYRMNNNSWGTKNVSITSITGNIMIDEYSIGDTLYAFLCKMNNDLLVHHSDIKIYITSSEPQECPLLHTFNGEEYILDNSLLPRSEYIEEDYIDIYRLQVKPSPGINNEVKFFITQNMDVSYIDVIKLLCVDHPKGRKTGIVYPDMRIISYVETDANYRAIDNNGNNFTDSVKTRGEGSWKGEKSGWLGIYKNIGTEYVLTLAVPPPRPKPLYSAGGIILWTRINPEDVIIFNIDTMMKYEPIDSLIEIDYINLIRGLPNSPIDMLFGNPNNIPEEMGRGDEIYYKINPKDTIYFSFIEPEMKNKGFERDYYIVVKGYYKKGGVSTYHSHNKLKEGEGIKVINAFGERIIIESDGNEEINVYDITGRKIKGFTIKKTINNNRMRYEIGGIPMGIYFIKVGNRFMKGVIIE